MVYAVLISIIPMRVIGLPKNVTVSTALTGLISLARHRNRRRHHLMQRRFLRRLPEYRGITSLQQRCRRRTSAMTCAEGACANNDGVAARGQRLNAFDNPNLRSYKTILYSKRSETMLKSVTHFPRGGYYDCELLIVLTVNCSEVRRYRESIGGKQIMRPWIIGSILAAPCQWRQPHKRASQTTQPMRMPWFRL